MRPCLARSAAFTPMNTTASNPPPIAATTGEDKTSAVLSYLTLVGFIIAVILHGNRKTRLGAFHLRQSLGLMLTSIALGAAGFTIMFVPFIGWLICVALWVGLAVLWVIGLVGAISGEMKPVPIIGEYYQQWFGTAFD